MDLDSRPRAQQDPFVSVCGRPGLRQSPLQETAWLILLRDHEMSVLRFPETRDKESFVQFKCFLFGARDVDKHQLPSGKTRRVRRTVLRKFKQEVEEKMIEKGLSNKDMQTDLLDQSEYQTLESGNYSTCLTENQLKECRRLGKRNAEVTRASLNATHTVIREQCDEVRDPMNLHHGFVFDFKWVPLSGLLTTHAWKLLEIGDLFLKQRKKPLRARMNLHRRTLTKRKKEAQRTILAKRTVKKRENRNRSETWFWRRKSDGDVLLHINIFLLSVTYFPLRSIL